MWESLTTVAATPHCALSSSFFLCLSLPASPSLSFLPSNFSQLSVCPTAWGRQPGFCLAVLLASNWGHCWSSLGQINLLKPFPALKLLIWNLKYSYINKLLCSHNAGFQDPDPKLKPRERKKVGIPDKAQRQDALKALWLWRPVIFLLFLGVCTLQALFWA